MTVSLLGIEILIVTPRRMQPVPQFAHQRDDRLQPGLAMGRPAAPAAPRRGQRGTKQGLAQPVFGGFERNL